MRQLGKKLKEIRNEAQLSSKKVKDGLNGLSSELKAINEDIKAEDTKTEKVYNKMNEMSKDMTTQDLNIDKKNEKMSAEIEAKLSEKIEKQIQKAIKAAAFETEVKLSKIGDDLKRIMRTPRKHTMK